MCTSQKNGAFVKTNKNNRFDKIFPIKITKEEN